MEDDVLQNPTASVLNNQEFYLGKYIKICWFLEPQQPRTRQTQHHNIIPSFHCPGSKVLKKSAFSPINALECLLDEEIIIC